VSHKLGSFLKNLHVYLSYSPHITILGIYPGDMKEYIPCARLFIAIFFE
jgi:hypothetical protein